jgi:hypothetical protein
VPATTVALDIRDYAELEVAAKRTHDEFGTIDIVLAAAVGNFPLRRSACSRKQGKRASRF